MPDKRQHRGKHPEDLEAFACDNWPRLQSAVNDLSWLLSRGYAGTAALKLVGDRYNLRERQRIAVMRCACSDAALAGRLRRQLSASALAGRALLIDGYNVLTTVEAALAGGIILIGRDGCYRDMASMHGTFHAVSETIPALTLLGGVLGACHVQRSIWYLDRPVSNSGRLRIKLLETAAEHGWPWEVELVTNPDPVLSGTTEIIVSADSVILDRCGPWFSLARETVDRITSNVHLVPLLV